MRRTTTTAVLVGLLALLGVLPAGPAATAASTPGAAPAYSFTPPVRVDPLRGQPADVSCPTTTSCVAVDRAGIAYEWRAGTWGAGRRLFDPGLVTSQAEVACHSTGTCVAVFPEHRRLATWRSGTWTVRTTSRAWAHVDCATDTVCVLASSRALDGLTPAVAFLVGDTVGAPTALPFADLDSVTCAGACLVGAHGSTGYGFVVRRVGTTWGWTAVTSDTWDLLLSCATATACQAYAGGQRSRWDGRAWTRTAGGQGHMDGFSCGAPDRCWASHPFDRVHYAGTGWTNVPGPGTPYDTWAELPFTALDCVGTSFCLEVDRAGRSSTWTGGAWSAPRRFAFDAGLLQDVSCGSPTLCLASDAYGKTTVFDGTRWSPVRSTAYAGIRSSCVVTWCMVLEGAETAWRTYEGGTWSTPKVLTVAPPDDASTLLEVKPACVDRGFCVALSNGGHALRWNGSSWTVGQQLYPADRVARASISCLSRTWCLLVENIGHTWSRWNGTAWSPPQALPRQSVAGFLELSCGTTAFCVAADSYESTSFDGTRWSAMHVSPGYWGPDDFQCFADRSCAGVVSGEVTLWTGTDWARTGTSFGPSGSFARTTQGGLSCVTPRFCALVAGDRAGVARA